MARKVIDISEKLKMEDNPVILVNGEELEVNTDAATILEIMGELGDENTVTPSSISKMCDLIFTDEAKKKIRKLRLKFDDYQTLVETAINLAVGGEEDEGNA